jgi:hypothetical protein
MGVDGEEKAIARIGHLLIQSRYLSVISVKWWSSCHGTFSRKPSGAIILRFNSRYGSEFKIYTRRYTQDVKQDANLAIPQQRQTFPKNEIINGKKVSLLFVLFESSEKIQTSICQQQVSDFISQTVLDEESELRKYSNDRKSKFECVLKTRTHFE